MRKRLTFCSAAILALALLGGLGSGSVQAGFITYEISVNTSSLSGESGFLDFQFNPGPIVNGNGALPASATITSFQTIGGAILPLSNPPIGNASGSLSNTLTLDNGTVLNDFTQDFLYGSSFSFDLTLSQPLDDPNGTVGSSFALTLFDSLFNSQLTTDPNGSVLTVNLNPDGTTFRGDIRSEFDERYTGSHGHPGQCRPHAFVAGLAYLRVTGWVTCLASLTACKSSGITSVPRRSGGRFVSPSDYALRAW